MTDPNSSVSSQNSARWNGQFHAAGAAQEALNRVHPPGGRRPPRLLAAGRLVKGRSLPLSFTLLITARAQARPSQTPANDKAALAKKTGKAEEAGCGDPLSDGTHGTTTWAPGRGVAGEAPAKQRWLATLFGLLVVTEVVTYELGSLAWACVGVGWLSWVADLSPMTLFSGGPASASLRRGLRCVMAARCSSAESRLGVTRVSLLLLTVN